METVVGAKDREANRVTAKVVPNTRGKTLKGCEFESRCGRRLTLLPAPVTLPPAVILRGTRIVGSPAE